jgi:predicted transcriptional regulator
MKTLPWSALDEIDRQILEDLYVSAPDCAKFLARRLKLDLGDTMERLRRLEKRGFLQRVEGRFLKKKGLRRPKHMNHTYYELTRPARLHLRCEM